MNIELSKNAVIAIVVVALLVVGLIFMRIANPPAPAAPPGYDPFAGSPGGGSPPR